MRPVYGQARSLPGTFLGSCPPQPDQVLRPRAWQRSTAEGHTVRTHRTITLLGSSDTVDAVPLGPSGGLNASSRGWV